MKRSMVAFACLLGCDSGANSAPITKPVPPPPPPIADAALALVAPADAAALAAVAPDAAADPAQPFFELPAAQVTKDGSAVLLKIVDDDGARGEPNLALELRDRRDRKTQRVVVVALDETPSADTLATRAAAATKLLAAHELVALSALAGGSDDHDAGHYEGAGITIDWAREHVTIKRDGKLVVDRAVPSAWRGGSWRNKTEGITCHNPDFLDGAYVSADANLVVVKVAYRGTDTCWEPTSQLHVIAW
jgi:hypothetical protein